MYPFIHLITIHFYTPFKGAKKYQYIRLKSIDN
nr:MAG TPA: hypothetical protein [Caudoviricetes sp.]